MRRDRVSVFALLAAAAAINPLAARVYATQEEVLGRIFSPEQQVDRRTAFLTDVQVERVRSDFGADLDSQVVTFYVGTRPGGEKATAYFDTHRVRTLAETLLILVDARGQVIRVEVLSFLEPGDYLPRDKWFEQFEGRELEDSLSLKRDIHGITGATLSARAVTLAVRRVLAIDTVLREERRTTSAGAAMEGAE
jgi:Na+-translocating ferredoxin:NAD+ oxidoreductase RnfG subunit